MIEVEEMRAHEVHALLNRADYAHLGCARDNRPYVMPIHYAYEDPDIYIFTTEGMKTEFIAANPEVCLQVEEVDGPTDWKSVIASGKAERLTDQGEIDHAMQLITKNNPTLTPALNKMWIDSWGRALNVTLYRIHPDIISGRQTIQPGETRGPSALGESVINPVREMTSGRKTRLPAESRGPSVTDASGGNRAI